ncbi:MAG: TetR/AcrR family transcriptional regulator [Microbacteriaceae bacterium]
MAQQVRSHAPRGEYTAQFWRDRGLADEPTTREKFVALAIDEVSSTGPHSFNATTICDLLGTTYPMVNHYFGNRDGLVAEAVAVAYRQYVESMRAAAESVTDDPRARLAAWIRQQIDWTVAHPGIAVVLDFPQASLEVSALLAADYQADMTDLFEYNMAIVMHLVLGVRHNEVLPIDFEPGKLPRERFMSDTNLVIRASALSMATLGAAIIQSGRPIQSAPVNEIDELGPEVMRRYIETLVEIAARD